MERAGVSGPGKSTRKVTFMPRRLEIRAENWPIAGRFAISRGAKTEAALLVAEIHDGTAVGRGECVPYARYGESLPRVIGSLMGIRMGIEDGLTRAELAEALSPGAARNALDCALWDLEAKLAGKPVHVLAGLPEPKPVTTAFTLSLDTPEAMAVAARNAKRPVLKLKLGAGGDIERLRAIRAAVPDAVLIADANEGWNEQNIEANLRACAEANVALVEQPLPADKDEILRTIPRLVPVCADESFHDRTSFDAVAGKYDALNIKLDKTGGFTEALYVANEAEKRGFALMLGCMVSTSLAMAPAMLLAARAKFVDLDGPLLLERDRTPSLRYEGSLVYPPSPEVWG